MSIEDILTELWRIAETGSTKKETGLETAALNFQDELLWENNFLGAEARDTFVGPLEERQMPDPEGGYSPEQNEEWKPFTERELDAIRHYYGQKIALENNNPLVGIGAPLLHEVTGDYGLTNPVYREESLYDLYVNAVATKDHYLDKGLPGTPFHQMLTDGHVTRREFNYWGNDALKRVPVFEVPEEKMPR